MQRDLSFFPHILILKLNGIKQAENVIIFSTYTLVNITYFNTESESEDLKKIIYFLINVIKTKKYTYKLYFLRLT